MPKLTNIDAVEPSDGSDLTEKQRAFCEAMAAGDTELEAAARAGYSGDSLHAAVRSLMESRRVWSYMAYLTRLKLSSNALRAAVRQGQLIDSKDEDVAARTSVRVVIERHKP